MMNTSNSDRMNLKSLFRRLDEQYTNSKDEDEREELASILLMLIEQGVTP